MLNCVKQPLNHTQGPCPKLLMPALEDFSADLAREFAKGKIYREIRVNGGIAAILVLRGRVASWVQLL